MVKGVYLLVLLFDPESADKGLTPPANCWDPPRCLTGSWLSFLAPHPPLPPPLQPNAPVSTGGAVQRTVADSAQSEPRSER